MSNKNLRYKSCQYELVMPQSSKVETIVVNYLEEVDQDKNTPLFKIFLPSENGFYKGPEYTEKNTLLGYANQKWRKLRSVQFEAEADKVLGVDELNSVSKLSKDDQLIKDSILATFA